MYEDETSACTNERVNKIGYLVIERMVLIIFIMLALILTACSRGERSAKSKVQGMNQGHGEMQSGDQLMTMGKGDVSVVDLEPGESNLYSQEDIYDAMEEVLDEFEEEFPDCVLTNLVYDEIYSLESAPYWAERYGDDEAIVFLSSFDVGENYKDGSLQAGESYQDWKWILTRDKGEEWELQTWGF
jgi:hypothetical protein